MSTPTPGPWIVWSSLYDGFGAAVVSGHLSHETLKTVAEVREYRDALVIAAALELLEALKVIVGYAEGDWDISAAEAARGIGRAAIAKAEGRA